MSTYSIHPRILLSVFKDSFAFYQIPMVLITKMQSRPTKSAKDKSCSQTITATPQVPAVGGTNVHRPRLAPEMTGLCQRGATMMIHIPEPLIRDHLLTTNARTTLSHLFMRIINRATGQGPTSPIHSSRIISLAHRGHTLSLLSSPPSTDQRSEMNPLDNFMPPCKLVRTEIATHLQMNILKNLMIHNLVIHTATHHRITIVLLLKDLPLRSHHVAPQIRSKEDLHPHPTCAFKVLTISQHQMTTGHHIAIFRRDKEVIKFLSEMKVPTGAWWCLPKKAWDHLSANKALNLRSATTCPALYPGAMNHSTKPQTSLLEILRMSGQNPHPLLLECVNMIKVTMETNHPDPVAFKVQAPAYPRRKVAMATRESFEWRLTISWTGG